jgi:hypothetical protein
LVVVAVLPAASSAVTVMVLSPVCSWIEAAVQVAFSTLPLSLAVPLPPRLLAHLTRYTHKLSVAVPVMPITPLPAADVPLTATVGATLSNALQRSLSACSSSAPSVGVVSCDAADGVSAPPHPLNARHANACATTSVVRLNCRFMFGIPRVDRLWRPKLTASVV